MLRFINRKLQLKVPSLFSVLLRMQEGQELMESKPEFEPIVKERLAQLHELWDKLESTTQAKAGLLFDANRSELFDQSLADIGKWLRELQQQLQSGDEDVKDLTVANILLKKHQVCVSVAFPWTYCSSEGTHLYA